VRAQITSEFRSLISQLSCLTTDLAAASSKHRIRVLSSQISRKGRERVRQFRSRRAAASLVLSGGDRPLVGPGMILILLHDITRCLVLYYITTLYSETWLHRERRHHLHAALCTDDTAHRAHRYDNVSDEALRSQAGRQCKDKQHGEAALLTMAMASLPLQLLLQSMDSERRGGAKRAKERKRRQTDEPRASRNIPGSLDRLPEGTCPADPW